MVRIRSWVAAVVLLGITCLSVSPAFAAAAKAGAGKQLVTAAQKGAAGADAHVKSDVEPTNKAGAKLPAPGAKGGAKTRDPYCYLTVDNWTGWNIRVYVEGVWVGNVAAWGDASNYYANGSTVYAKAFFDDGSVLTWGPMIIPPGTDTYRWRLNP